MDLPGRILTFIPTVCREVKDSPWSMLLHSGVDIPLLRDITSDSITVRRMKKPPTGFCALRHRIYIAPSLSEGKKKLGADKTRRTHDPDRPRKIRRVVRVNLIPQIRAEWSRVIHNRYFHEWSVRQSAS